MTNDDRQTHEQHKRISKLVALMLRHDPDAFGLEPDENGFADLDTVWRAVQTRLQGRVTRADFDAMLLSEGGQQRYEVQARRIRALYGHSTVEVAYAPVVPPEVLYHGTVAAALAAIRAEGLTSQARQYVHLSANRERALSVAQRHGKPVLLSLRAHAAHEAGIIFYQPEPQHFLVRSLPPTFIDFPIEPEE